MAYSHTFNGEEGQNGPTAIIGSSTSTVNPFAHALRFDSPSNERASSGPASDLNDDTMIDPALLNLEANRNHTTSQCAELPPLDEDGDNLPRGPLEGMQAPPLGPQTSSPPQSSPTPQLSPEPQSSRPPPSSPASQSTPIQHAVAPPLGEDRQSSPPHHAESSPSRPRSVLPPKEPQQTPSQQQTQQTSSALQQQQASSSSSPTQHSGNLSVDSSSSIASLSCSIDRSGWPEHFNRSFDYFTEGKEWGSIWARCIKAWVFFERSRGFPVE